MRVLSPTQARRPTAPAPRPATKPRPPLPTLARKREDVLRLLSGVDRLADLPPDVAAFVLAVAHRVPLPPGKKLLEHQGVGVAYGLVSRFRMLLGDAQGLGKTCQGVAMLSLGGARLVPAVLVAPASVLHDWAAAFKEWGPWFRQVPLLKRDSHVSPPRGPTVYLTTWDLLPYHQIGLRQVGVRTLLADEVSFGKHATARRSEALADLAGQCPHVVFLSGTAAENTREELWHVLHLLDPKRFDDAKAFKELAQSDPEALSNLLPEYMCRRLKTAVLEALPPKKRSIVLLDLPASVLTEYRKAQADMWTWVARQRRQRVLIEAVDSYRRVLAVARMAKEDVDEADLFDRTLADANRSLASRQLTTAEVALLKFGELRRMVGRIKVGPALQWLRTWFGTGPGQRAPGTASPSPVVLFAEHQDVIHALESGCERLGLRAGVIDGNTPKTTRRALTQAFQAGELDVIIGSQAMAYGVTLTRSADVVFVERWFVPTREEQAEDRAHRLTQTREVHVRKLVVRGTVDEAVTELVDRKAAVIATVMGAEDVDVQAGGATVDLDHNFTAQVATTMWTAGVLEDVGSVAAGLRPFTAEELRTALGVA